MDENLIIYSPGYIINMSQTGGQTAMQFVYVEFDQNWQIGNIGEWGKEYRAIKDGASITVVAEDTTGNKTTYWYKLSNGVVVWTSANHNIIFIPGLCVKAMKGDNSTCGKLSLK